jgi:hypothetical protein
MGAALRRYIAIIVGVVAGLAMAAPLQAEDSPNLLENPFRFSLGSFIMESDVRVRLDGDTGRGTPVDWGRTFGGGDATRFRIDGYWRFGERHRVRGMWFNNSWDRSRTLEDEIEWNGEIYPVEARVRGEFGIDVYELAYDYSFLQRENYELTAGIGLHWTAVEAGLGIRGSGGEVEATTKGKGSVDLPLPVIAIGGLWRLPHNFWISGMAQLFALEIDDYDGTLQDLTVALTWQPKSWVGVGIAYNYFGVDVDVDKQRFHGNLDWIYDGPMIFYNVSF